MDWNRTFLAAKTGGKYLRWASRGQATIEYEGQKIASLGTQDARSERGFNPARTNGVGTLLICPSAFRPDKHAYRFLSPWNRREHDPVAAFIEEDLCPFRLVHHVPELHDFFNLRQKYAA